MIDEIARVQFGVLSRDQLRATLTDRQIDGRLEDGRLAVVHRGVYRVEGAPVTWHARVMAGCLAGGEAAVASHLSAGRLWGLIDDTDAVEILVPSSSSARLRSVRVHHTREPLNDDRRVVDGIPVASPELTLLHLATRRRPDQLDTVIDDALRRGLTTVAKLRFRLRMIGGRGRPGSARLRSLLELRTGRLDAAESPLERHFLSLVRSAGLPEPIPQLAVRDASGRTIARVDAAWPDHGVAVELDGARWHARLDRWQRDLERQNELMAAGLRVYRFTWWDVRQRPGDVVRKLQRALARASSF